MSVHFEGDSIEGGDTFIGPLESGATGNVDAMVSGVQATMDEGKIKAVISYENESGVVTKEEKEIELFVTEPVFDESMMEDDFMMDEEPKKNRMPVIIAAAAVLVIAAAIVLIVVLKKRKKKKLELTELAELEEELKDEE